MSFEDSPLFTLKRIVDFPLSVKTAANRRIAFSEHGAAIPFTNESRDWVLIHDIIISDYQTNPGDGFWVGTYGIYPQQVQQWILGFSVPSIGYLNLHLYLGVLVKGLYYQTDSGNGHMTITYENITGKMLDSLVMEETAWGQ